MRNFWCLSSFAQCDSITSLSDAFSNHYRKFASYFMLARQTLTKMAHRDKSEGTRISATIMHRTLRAHGKNLIKDTAVNESFL